MLIDRVVPSLKAVDAPVALAPSNVPADLAGAAAAVLSALVNGQTTPDQAAAIASVLSALARVREVAEFEARITALETRATTPEVMR